jgi:hypothetical protein
MNKGKLYEIFLNLSELSPILKDSTKVTFVCDPNEAKGLLDEAKLDFPKKKKIYKYHVGGEYGTDIYEEAYSQKEIDEWKLRWFGDK